MKLLVVTIPGLIAFGPDAELCLKVITEILLFLPNI